MVTRAFEPPPKAQKETKRLGTMMDDDTEAMARVAEGTTGAHTDDSEGDVVNEDMKRDQLRVLPPAANWYCSHVCDWGYDARTQRQFFAFGAKNGICIYEFRLSAPSARSTSSGSAPSIDDTLRKPLRTTFVALVSRGKRDLRVTALRFLTGKRGEPLIVCTGEEKATQIWDVSTLTMIEQHRKHTAEIAAVSVRTELDPNLIVAGDREGGLSVWQRDSGSVSLFVPIARDAIFTLEIAAHDKNIVAVGYRSGILCIVDLPEGIIRHRLDGHDLEIQSLAWRLRLPSSSQTRGDEQSFLASSSRDRTIKIWKFEDKREPELATSLEVRKPQSSSHSQSTRLWLPVSWSSCRSTYRLWSGSFEGNLQMWEWQGRPTCPTKPVPFRNGHSRLLFSIVPTRLLQDTLPSNEQSLILTMSLDREVRLWKESATSQDVANTLVCVDKISGHGGFTYSLDFNRQKCLLAAGVGDQSIRLWYFGSKQHTTGYHTDLLWKGLQSKVTVVRWHPVHDTILAYATDDGRLGVWDVQARTNTRAKISHSGAVLDLVWTMHSTAKRDSDGKDAFLQAVEALEKARGEGLTLDAALHSQPSTTKRTDGETEAFIWSRDAKGGLFRTDADKLSWLKIRNDCRSFAWDRTSTSLAIGLKNGCVELLRYSDREENRPTHDLAPILILHEHVSEVSALAWSVRSSHILASGSTNGNLFVYQTELHDESIQVKGAFSQLPGYGQHVIAALDGHSSSITCLRWSPGDLEWILASSSDDGTVRVWDVKAGEIRASFNHHIGRVLSVSWLSTTILTSSGQDQSIRLWEYKHHPPPKVSKTPRKSKQHSRAAGSALGNGLVSEASRSPTELILQEKANATSASKSMDSRGKPKKSKQRGDIFHLDSFHFFGDVERQFADQQEQSFNDQGNAATSLDDCRKPIDDFLASEQERFLQEKDWDRLAQLYLLEGRVSDALRVLAVQGALTPEWVSYAPMAGEEVWREISYLYATQLHQKGDMKGAALQYLVHGDVEASVRCFVDGKMYREAIAVVQTRLGPNHALLSVTVENYADYLEMRKLWSDAARVLLTLGSKDAKRRAISLLASCDDIDSLKLAVALWVDLRPTSANDEEDGGSIRHSLPSSVLLSIVHGAMAQDEFDVAAEAIDCLRMNSSTSGRLDANCLLYTLSHAAIDISKTIRMTLTTDVVNLPKSRNELFCRLEHGCNAMRGMHSLLSIFTHRSSHPWEVVIREDWMPRSDVRFQRASMFWEAILGACHAAGFWFNSSELEPIDNVLELLSQSSLFDFVTPAHNLSSRHHLSRDTELLISVSRSVLHFVVELLCGYLLSALEVLRDLLTTLSSRPLVIRDQDDGSVSLLSLLLLLFPGGLLDLTQPPNFGELAEEGDETKTLWRSFFLFQCEAILQVQSAVDGTLSYAMNPDVANISTVLELSIGCDPALVEPSNREHFARLRKQIELSIARTEVATVAIVTEQSVHAYDPAPSVEKE